MTKDRNLASVTSNVELFLEKAAKVQQSESNKAGKIIFALDATASRQAVWDMATSIQGSMFREVDSIGSLEVKLLYYSGISECRVSKWISNSAKLETLMEKVKCKAGRTQICRVLDYVNSISSHDRINALIFVGDSVEESHNSLTNSAAKLGLLGIPLYVFHEGYDIQARNTFKTIARLTKGACFSFDSSTPRTLSMLLRGVASFIVGGSKSLDCFAKENGAEGLLIAKKLRGHN